MNPLVTIIVLCYRNFRYVYQTLDSIFAQDYPNIELIVSDDGSANFPEEKIRTYIEKNAGENITSRRINHNAQNMGTVKHLNVAAKLAKGEYFMSVSADDAIDHPEVVSTYVRELSARPDADILMAQTAMYDENMKKVLYYFVQPHIREILLHHQDSNALFNELVQHPYLPSVSTFFRHAFFEKYGYFDEAYDLVEDWSLHLKIARQHIPIVYVDFVSIRHRSGGISHGNTAGTSNTYRRYLRDLQQTYDAEIAPYLSQVPAQIRNRVHHQHRVDSAWIDWHVNEKEHGVRSLLRHLTRYWMVAIYKHLPDIRNRTRGKQWYPLLLGLLLGCIGGWLSSVLGESCWLLFGSDAVFYPCFAVFSFISTLLIVFGSIFLVLYYISAFYIIIMDKYQIYIN